MNIRSLIYLTIFASSYTMACGGDFFVPERGSQTPAPQPQAQPARRVETDYNSGHMQPSRTPTTPQTPVSNAASALAALSLSVASQQATSSALAPVAVAH